MIGSVDTYIDSEAGIPEKYVIYYSNSDFEYAIPVSGRCRLTLELSIVLGIMGVIPLIISSLFYMDVSNTKAQIVAMVLYFFGGICLIVSTIMLLTLFNI